MFGRALNHGINKGEYGSPLSRIEGERVKLRRQGIHEKGRNKLATKAEKEEPTQTLKVWDTLPPPKLDSTQTNQLSDASVGPRLPLSTDVFIRLNASL